MSLSKIRNKVVSTRQDHPKVPRGGIGGRRAFPSGMIVEAGGVWKPQVHSFTQGSASETMEIFFEDKHIKTTLQQNLCKGLVEAKRNEVLGHRLYQSTMGGECNRNLP